MEENLGVATGKNCEADMIRTTQKLTLIHPVRQSIEHSLMIKRWGPVSAELIGNHKKSCFIGVSSIKARLKCINLLQLVYPITKSYISHSR